MQTRVTIIRVKTICAKSIGGTYTYQTRLNRVLCIQVKQTEFNPMSFVSWSVYPKGQEFDAEYFTSEDHAVDVAYSWSADEHGKTMIVARNDMMWMEVSC